MALSLHDLFQAYSWRNKQWRKRRNSTKVVLRVYPRYSPNQDDPHYEDYCRTKVILHHPFATLDQVTRAEDGRERTWREIFEACLQDGHAHPADTLRDAEQERQRTAAEVEDDDEDVEVDPDSFMMEEADWQLFARLFPNAALPNFDASDLGHRPIDNAWNPDESRARWANVDRMASYIADKRRETAGQDAALEDEAPVDINTLEEEQRVVYDRFVDTYRAILDGDNVEPLRLNIDGTAGCGKTYLIRAICQELRRMAADQGLPDPIRVLAPSGVAAWNIGGRTIHSALSLPATAVTAFAPLSGSRLTTLQQHFQGVHFIVFDEKSMIGQRMLPKVDSRLRQLKATDSPFGNCHVALFGDFAQLPPVGDRPLYAPPCPPDQTSEAAQASRDGSTLYSSFFESFRLQVVHRQQGESTQQQCFRTMLEHARNGGLTTEDWKLLLTRFEGKLSPAERASFDDAMCLFTKSEAVEAANLKQLEALGRPCARIKAKHDGGPDATKASAEDAAGLEAEVILARGAKVMITRNVWQEHGACQYTSPFTLHMYR